MIERQLEGNLATTLEGQLFEQEISARGYYEISHEIPDEKIDELIEAYLTFTMNHPDPEPKTMDLMLPKTDDPSILRRKFDDLDYSQDKQSGWHKYRTNTPYIAKPLGYSNRTFQSMAMEQERGLLIYEDPKEFFHFTPGLYGLMARQHETYDWGPIPPEVDELNKAFAFVHHKAVNTMLRVAGLIEESHPNIGDFLDRQALLASPIRLVSYHPSDNEQLAEGHFDKWMTLQLAESHEGLRVAVDENAELMPVVRDSSKAVYFSGPGAHQLEISDDPESGFKLVPGWHDVIAVDTLNKGRSVPEYAADICARYAIILFANPTEMVIKSKDELHSRTLN